MACSCLSSCKLILVDKMMAQSKAFSKYHIRTPQPRISETLFNDRLSSVKVIGGTGNSTYSGQTG